MTRFFCTVFALCAFLFSAPAVAVDAANSPNFMFESGGDRVTFLQEPCGPATSFVLAVRGESPEGYKQAVYVSASGDRVEGCWRVMPGSQTVVMSYEDGDQGMVRLSSLVPETKSAPTGKDI